MFGVLAGGLMLGGGILQGIGAYQQGKFQSAMADFNARQSAIDAKIAQQNADAKAKAMRQQGKQLTARQRTRYAKSGVRLEGTPLEVMARSIEAVEMDAIHERQRGRFEAGQHMAQSQMSKTMGKQHSKAGTLGLISGVLGGAAGAAGMFA